MARHHVTIVGRDTEAMADLVRRHHVTVARHTLEKRARGYLVHAHASSEQIRALERDGYRVRRLENVDQAGARRQAEVRKAATQRAKGLVAGKAMAGGYLTVAEVEDALATLAATNAGVVELITLPNQTWEQRTCTAIRIGHGPTGARPGIYFLGGVHAREWGSPDILINFSRQLLAAYAAGTGITLGKKTFTAAHIRNIVEKRDVFVFPQANPDGRLYSMETDAMWRKNRRPAPAGHTGAACVGVEFNRNYDFLWSYPKYFSPSAPIVNSIDPCDDLYIGPAAISEPETQNVVWLLDQYPRIAYLIDVHSYGEDILYNWGDDDDQTTDPSMSFKNASFDGQRGIVGSGYREYLAKADKASAVRLANRMAAAIKRVRGRAYKVEQSVGLYPTAGTSDDYAFSRHLLGSGTGKVLSFTIEWGRESNSTPFHPPYPEMAQIIQEITAALLEFCMRAE